MWTAFFIVLYFLSSQVVAPNPSQASLRGFAGKKVAIVGAGSVGLYTARQIADENQNVEIKIFDDLSTPIMNQIVSLNQWDIPTKDSRTKQGHQSTQYLQHLLRVELQNRLQIVVQNWKFETIEGLIAEFYRSGPPDAIIFATGEESDVSHKFFGGMFEGKTHTSFCSVKYRRTPYASDEALDEAQTKRLSQLTGSRIFQGVGSNVNVHLVMAGPYNNAQFTKKIAVLINARRVELRERLIDIPRPEYHRFNVEIAKSFQAKYNNIDLFLIGDAAAKLPYHLRLESGFTAARLLARAPAQYNENAAKLFKKMDKNAKEKTQNDMFHLFDPVATASGFRSRCWRQDYEDLLMRTDDMLSNIILEHPLTKNRFSF